MRNTMSTLVDGEAQEIIREYDAREVIEIAIRMELLAFEIEEERNTYLQETAEKAESGDTTAKAWFDHNAALASEEAIATWLMS